MHRRQEGFDCDAVKSLLGKGAFDAACNQPPGHLAGVPPILGFLGEHLSKWAGTPYVGQVLLVCVRRAVLSPLSSPLPTAGAEEAACAGGRAIAIDSTCEAYSTIFPPGSCHAHAFRAVFAARKGGAGVPRGHVTMCDVEERDAPSGLFLFFSPWFDRGTTATDFTLSFVAWQLFPDEFRRFKSQLRKEESLPDPESIYKRAHGGPIPDRLLWKSSAISPQGLPGGRLLTGGAEAAEADKADSCAGNEHRQKLATMATTSAMSLYTGSQALTEELASSSRRIGKEEGSSGEDELSMQVFLSLNRRAQVFVNAHRDIKVERYAFTANPASIRRDADIQLIGKKFPAVVSLLRENAEKRKGLSATLAKGAKTQTVQRAFEGGSLASCIQLVAHQLRKEFHLVVDDIYFERLKLEIEKDMTPSTVARFPFTVSKARRYLWLASAFGVFKLLRSVYDGWRDRLQESLTQLEPAEPAIDNSCATRRTWRDAPQDSDFVHVELPLMVAPACITGKVGDAMCRALVFETFFPHDLDSFPRTPDPTACLSAKLYQHQSISKADMAKLKARVLEEEGVMQGVAAPDRDAAVTRCVDNSIADGAHHLSLIPCLSPPTMQGTSTTDNGAAQMDELLPSSSSAAVTRDEIIDRYFSVPYRRGASAVATANEAEVSLDAHKRILRDLYTGQTCFLSLALDYMTTDRAEGESLQRTECRRALAEAAVRVSPEEAAGEESGPQLDTAAIQLTPKLYWRLDQTEERPRSEAEASFAAESPPDPGVPRDGQDVARTGPLTTICTIFDAKGDVLARYSSDGTVDRDGLFAGAEAAIFRGRGSGDGAGATTAKAEEMGGGSEAAAAGRSHQEEGGGGGAGSAAQRPSRLPIIAVCFAALRLAARRLGRESLLLVLWLHFNKLHAHFRALSPVGAVADFLFAYAFGTERMIRETHEAQMLRSAAAAAASKSGGGAAAPLVQSPLQVHLGQVGERWQGIIFLLRCSDYAFRSSSSEATSTPTTPGAAQASASSHVPERLTGGKAMQTRCPPRPVLVVLVCSDTKSRAHANAFAQALWDNFSFLLSNILHEVAHADQAGQSVPAEQMRAASIATGNVTTLSLARLLDIQANFGGFLKKASMGVWASIADDVMRRAESHSGVEWDWWKGFDVTGKYVNGADPAQPPAPPSTQVRSSAAGEATSNATSLPQAGPRTEAPQITEALPDDYMTAFAELLRTHFPGVAWRISVFTQVRRQAGVGASNAAPPPPSIPAPAASFSPAGLTWPAAVAAAPPKTVPRVFLPGIGLVPETQVVGLNPYASAFTPELAAPGGGLVFSTPVGTNPAPQPATAAAAAATAAAPTIGAPSSTPASRAPAMRFCAEVVLMEGGPSPRRLVFTKASHASPAEAQQKVLRKVHDLLTSVIQRIS